MKYNVDKRTNVQYNKAKRTERGDIMCLEPSVITDEEVMTYLKQTPIEGPIPDMETYQRYKRCEYIDEEIEIARIHLQEHPEIIEKIRRGDKVLFF